MKTRIGKAMSAGSLFSGDPPDTFWSKWVAGIAFPIWFCCLAINTWISGTSAWWGRGSKLPLSGVNAAVMGFVQLGIGLFLFSHFFLGNIERGYRFRDYGKFLGLVIGLGAFLFIMCRVLAA